MTRHMVGIIGAGKVGLHLKARLETMGYSVALFSRSHASYSEGQTQWDGNIVHFVKKHELKLQAVFLTISTKDTGEAALAYVRDCFRLGVPVITCEKAILAYHAYFIEQHVHLTASNAGKSLRYNAAVSGGVQALQYLRSRRLKNHEVEVEAVINGTLNYVFHFVASGMGTLGEACDSALKEGYAEPGASDPVSLINAELHDVKMKTAVLYNTCMASKHFITPANLEWEPLSAVQISELAAAAANYRLVVSFSNHNKGSHKSYYDGHFETTADGWRIEGGLRKTQDDPALREWLPAGVHNAVHITEGDLGRGGAYTLKGPGAGLEATTTAMINDFLN